MELTKTINEKTTEIHTIKDELEKGNEAVSLILVMVGGLLISFGSFSMILKIDKKSIVTTLTFVTLGQGIIVMSLLLNN